MRYIISAILFVMIFNANGADTLTRAQVYNFAAGDTFDYRITRNTTTNPMGTGEVYNTTVSYTRFKVTQIYWSLDSSTKYIVRQQLYPVSGFDTTVLVNLNGFEVIMDTSWYNPNFANNFFVIDTAPNYFGQTTNAISFFCCAPGWDVIFFGRGLGKVLENTYGGALSNHYNDTTLLIYYAGINGIYGQPFTSFPTAEIETPATENPFVSISPNPGSGKFMLRSNAKKPYRFFLYDLAGREVLNLLVNNKTSQLDITRAGAGLYYWKTAFDDSKTITGKIVIE